MGTQSGPAGPIGSSGKQFFLTVGEALLPSSSFTHKSTRQLKDLLQIASLLGKTCSAILTVYGLENQGNAT
jgi:hypothetical protein